MVLAQMIEFFVNGALPAIIVRETMFFVEEEGVCDAAGDLFAELIFWCFGISVGFVDVGEAGMGSLLVGDPSEVWAVV